MAQFLTEADVERSLLDTFRDLGYEIASGPDIAPGGERPERESHEDVILVDRLRSALVRLNRDLPSEAIDEAVRKLARAESPSLAENNRRFHRMLVEGVDVEVQKPGRISY